MKKSVKTILIAALLLIGIVSVTFIATATDYPFDNLFEKGFAGYTSDETEVLTDDFYSSKKIAVAAGETVWFGPCDSTQYFQLVGFDVNGEAVTDKVRGKDLEVADAFNNDMVIYKYEVPEGVAELVFSAPSSKTTASIADVYVVSKTELTCLNWQAYWELKNMDTEEYVGKSSYYEIKKGDKLYFGVITEEDALETVVYNSKAENIGTINETELELVESFGGDLGIYCYTVDNDDAKYVKVNYDINYEQYYTSVLNPTGNRDSIVEQFIVEYEIQRPLSSTVTTLAGKSALFVGDSITYGARDRAKIYEYGGWAGRIGYFCDMDVLNNGVSGACITTARVESHSTGHYIYNNLVAAKEQEFDYVIMHGLFNDASITPAIELGTVQGPQNFNPNTADVTKFADALELLFYTAKQQHPEATLGYIVNFHTERAVDQTPFVEIAIEICKAWGIEYLDLYNNKTFSVEFDDGLHPSSAGYDSMYTIVANWMATLGQQETVDNATSSAKIMSYNVFWNTNDANTGITDRVSKIINVIKQEAPDVLVLQEVSGGTQGWVPVLTNFGDTYGYGYYGYTHQNDTYVDSSANVKDTTNANDEMTVILWNTTKYDCVDKGHFWASGTPDVPGSLWTGVKISGTKDYPRCINWVVLKDKTTNEKLLVVDYHADPYTETIRNLSAQLIVEKVAQIRAQHDNLAVVIGGDWNMQRGDVAYTTVTGNGYGDIQKEATQTTTQGSYNAWTREEAKFGFGDYWFMNEDVSATIYEVVDDFDADAQKYLSDHSPIVAEIEY